MKPDNSKDRSSAFGRFLLFFLLTVVVMAVAIFFGIRVPYAENNKLRERLSRVDSEIVFRENFMVSMMQAQTLLDSVNKVSPTMAGLIDGRITQCLQSMDAMIGKSDSTHSKKIYTQIIKALNDSKSDKTSLRAASSKDSLASNYNRQIEDLKTNLQQWKDAYFQLKATVPTR